MTRNRIVVAMGLATVVALFGSGTAHAQAGLLSGVKGLAAVAVEPVERHLHLDGQLQGIEFEFPILLLGHLLPDGAPEVAVLRLRLAGQVVCHWNPLHLHDPALDQAFTLAEALAAAGARDAPEGEPG